MREQRVEFGEGWGGRVRKEIAEKEIPHVK